MVNCPACMISPLSKSIQNSLQYVNAQTNDEKGQQEKNLSSRSAAAVKKVDSEFGSHLISQGSLCVLRVSVVNWSSSYEIPFTQTFCLYL